MFNQIQTQGTLTKTLVDDYLLTWFEAFLTDRKARGLAEGKIKIEEAKPIILKGELIVRGSCSQVCLDKYFGN